MGTALSLFEKHIEVIKKSGYSVVPSITQREHQVMICFDDGWEGIYDNKDFFVKQNIFPTIFIAVSLIGTEGHLSKYQIKELQAAGFRLQAHTWSHEDLTSFSSIELEKELMDSKAWLQKEFNCEFNAICYPMGRFSKLVFEKSREYGYTQQFSSIPGGYYEMEDEGLICRICAQFSSVTEFKWMLNSTSMFFRRRLYRQQFTK